MIRKFIFIFCILLLGGLAFANSGTVYLNDMNTTDEFLIPVTLVQGETVFIDLVSGNENLSYSFPSEVNLTDSDNVTISIEVSKKPFFFGNAEFTSIFRLYNSYNYNFYDYNITAVVNTSSSLNESSDYFVQIVNGNYIYNISENLLDTRGHGEAKFEISGLSGSDLFLECDSWLVCPDTQTFDANNMSSFVIAYHVPSNISDGRYTQKVTLTTGNVSKNTTLVFNILEPEIVFTQYEFAETCYTKCSDGSECIKLECQIEAELYNIKRFGEMWDYWKVLRDDDSHCENSTETLYVGNVDEEVVAELKLCIVDRESLHTQNQDLLGSLSVKEKNINVCQSELATANRAILNNETQCLQNAFDASVQMKASAEKYKEVADEEAEKHRVATYRVVWILIIGVVITILAVLAYLLHKREKWN